jgi:3-oxoacyl-[acyl-carrier-protein] synthase II
MRRVVVTGIGLVSAFGCDAETIWRALCAGDSATRALDDIDGNRSVRVIGAPVSGFSAREYIDGKSLRLMAPAVAYGVAAAELAARDSGRDFAAVDPTRLGAFVGSRGHSSDRQDLLAAVRLATENGHFRLDRYGAEGLARVHPMWLLKGLANNVLYFISLKYNAQGMNNNVSMGGVAGTMAIGEAFDAIRHGDIDVAFAGGYDSCLDADRLEMFARAGLFASADDPRRASRPFCATRTGFVPGEGAAMLLMESLDVAQRRGARIHGELLGYGNATGRSSSTAARPSAEGFARALEVAMTDAAGVTPDAVLAHGFATRAIDEEETLGLKRAFGAAAETIPAPALTSMIGYTFAASGAIQAAIALLGLRDGRLPPTINLFERDLACDLDYVAGTEARPASLTAVAVNAANLAGAHASLLIGRVT